MKYMECLKAIQDKLPIGWRSCLHPSPTIRKDRIDMEWWYSLTDESGYSVLGGYTDTLADAYAAIMQELNPKPCDAEQAHVEDVDHAT